MEFQEFRVFQSQKKSFKAIPQKTCWGFIINESLTSSSAIKYNTEIFNSYQNKIVNEQLRFSKKSVQGHFCALHQIKWPCLWIPKYLFIIIAQII